MNSNKLGHFVLTISVVIFLVALTSCAKKTVPVVEETDKVMVEEVSETKTESDVEVGEVNEGMGAAETLDTQVIDNTDSESLEGRTSVGLFPLYFDFDKSVIRSDQVDIIERNAAFMKANPGLRVRIEGNCDERGTNEYNMALGQRRAMSAQQYLVNLGVAGSRLDVISYGEERPINFGHDDLSWSQNRRDDFVIAK